MKLRFWGVRGSVPTPLPQMMGYGGNTSCLSAALGEDEHLILDAGTGIRQLGNALTEGKPSRPQRFHILFTHFHLDHIQGLPFFSPLYDRTADITFYGVEREGWKLRRVLEGFLTPPYFPVPLGSVPSRTAYKPLTGEPLRFGDLRLSTLPLNHPNGSVSFRLERGDRRIVLATDHEHGDDETDRALERFSVGADHLIYDATYVPHEYEQLRRGWGHSTWYEGVQIAKKAGVKTLILFHHHPGHTDAQLEAVLEVARKELPGVEIAREGMELPL